jgi:hypothetical protein
MCVNHITQEYHSEEHLTADTCIGWNRNFPSAVKHSLTVRTSGRRGQGGGLEINANNILSEKNSNVSCDFKVCKSVYHRTIQIDHQADATIFQFIILTFIYSSTCFGRSPAHHQELNDCSSSLWLYLRIVVKVVLCSWLGRPAGNKGTLITLKQNKIIQTR